MVDNPWSGWGFCLLTWLGYIDGIHGTPYIAAPLGSVMGNAENIKKSWGNLGFWKIYVSTILVPIWRNMAIFSRPFVQTYTSSNLVRSKHCVMLHPYLGDGLKPPNMNTWLSVCLASINLCIYIYIIYNYIYNIYIYIYMMLAVEV